MYYSLQLDSSADNSNTILNECDLQMQNYLRKKELKEQRERELREGLKLYKSALDLQKDTLDTNYSYKVRTNILLLLLL